LQQHRYSRACVAAGFVLRCSSKGLLSAHYMLGSLRFFDVNIIRIPAASSSISDAHESTHQCNPSNILIT